jgi:dCMP deaminase
MSEIKDITYRRSWDFTFIEFMEVLAKRSLCLKYKTSALVVKGTQILCMGYNGTFSGRIECCNYWRDYYNRCIFNKEMITYEQFINSDNFRLLHHEWSTANEIHAEVNALNWISKKDIDDSYVLYTLYSPCDNCAKTIISYGIKNVVYKYKYKNGTSALKRLSENGIIYRQI